MDKEKVEADLMSLLRTTKGDQTSRHRDLDNTLDTGDHQTDDDHQNSSYLADKDDLLAVE